MNVASECGYTESNYRELVQLQSDYQGKPFTVLGFPSNDFGGQEPGSDEDILNFTSEKYQVNFPLFSKVNVIGDEASDLYKYLFSETYAAPQWNFCKYLVDGTGNVLQFFSQEDPFTSVRETLNYLLANKTELWYKNGLQSGNVAAA